MSAVTIPSRFSAWRAALTPQVLLSVAGLVVAAAILAGPAAARFLNGIGGALWVAAAVWMVVSLRGERRRLPIGCAALIGALLMAVVVRPGTYPEAAVGFLVAGGVVALMAGNRGGHWALLAPALYFPLHIAIAIGRVLASGGVRSVRTDPPPTEAFVPMAMILAAAVGGVLVSRLVAHRVADRGRR